MAERRSTRTRPLPRPADEALATALEHVLVDALGAAQRVEGLHRLSGGASRETFAFDAISSDGVARPLILQRERPGGAINTGGGTSTEAGLLRAAAAQGVPVPAVVASGPAEDARAGEGPGEPLGAAYLVVERLEGETIPRRILRDEQYAGARARLAAQCGRALAGIHAIPVEDAPGRVDGDLEALRARHERTRLRDALRDAVAEEDFERAAELRDRLRAMEGDG